MDLYALKAAAVLLSLVGLAGTVVPAIPGPLLIFATALGYGWATGFVDVGGALLWWLGGLAALAQISDFLTGALSVRLVGGTRWAMIGAALGLLVGVLIMGPLGLLIGPFAGAFVAELLAGRDAGRSGRAGLAAGVGALAGIAVQGAIAVVMITLFWIRIF